MIWDLALDHPNLKYMLEKEKQNQIDNQQTLEAFNKSVSQIDDKNTQKLINENIALFRDVNGLKEFKMQVNTCYSLQQLMNNIISSIQSDNTSLSQITIKLQDYKSLLQESQNITNQHPEVKKYFEQQSQHCYNVLSNKYEQSITKQLKLFGFPMQQQSGDYDQQQITELCLFIRQFREIWHDFMKSTFDEMNQKCEYHFIDLQQVTAAVDQPKWFYSYLQENIENVLNPLIEIMQNYENQQQIKEAIGILGLTLIDHHIVFNITKRLSRDSMQLKNDPNLALKFLEAGNEFVGNLNAYWNNNLEYQLDRNISQIIITQCNDLQILNIVLSWEHDLIKINLFKEYDRLYEHENNVQLFLNFVEEFQIIQNSLYSKYIPIAGELQLKIDQEYQYIFDQFIKQCREYFNVIYDCKQQRIDYVQYLQTYFIGLKSIKQMFPKQHQVIKQLKKNTIHKFNEQLECKTVDEIYSKLLKQQLQDKDAQQFYATNSKMPIYLNNQVYQLQSTQEFARTLNNFSNLASFTINEVIKQNLIQRNYNMELNGQICKRIANRLINKLQTEALKLKFSYEGINVFIMVVLRTTVLYVMQSVDMHGSKDYKKHLDRIEQLRQAVGGKPVDRLPLLNVGDIEFVQQLQINTK